jgi:tRNA threonylcarbamoyladenosine biosynthesis protein TsaB
MSGDSSKLTSPLLLCLETAGSSCSVCLSSGTKILIEKEEQEAFKHNELLAEFTHQILKASDLTISQLSAIVINQGPGSYTGLRVGFAFGKALAYASGKPLLTVSGLEGMVDEAAKTTSADLYIPMLDARRMEVYLAVYGSDLSEIEEPAPVEITEAYFSRQLFQDKNVLLIGEASEKTMQISLPSNFSKINLDLKASNLIGPALRRIELGAIDPAYIEPMYLKEARITTSKKTLK